ncbi:MAG: hypothetical protein HY999_02855 [Nitrospinae bacterium]|nr:hypothetical protein [Nitrospinota bacterium]
MSQSKIENRKSKIKKIELFIMLGLAVVLVIILTYRSFGERKTNIPLPPPSRSGSIPEDHPDLILKDIKGLLTEGNHDGEDKGVQKPIESSLKRDIFSPTISLHTNDLSPSEKREEDEEDKIEDTINQLKLKATIINNQRPISIINDKILGIGEDIMGFKVVEIKDGVVFLSNGRKEISLDMKGKNNETLQ